MKTIIKRFLPHTGLCLLALALAACSNPALPQVGDGASFTSTADLAAYLSGKPANTAAAPYRVSLSGVDLSAPGAFDAVLAALSGRYADLDLSGCTGAEIPARSSTVLPAGAEYLAAVTLPESAAIGRMAFYGFAALKTVTVSGGTRSVGDFAFALCPALAEITLPGTLESMGTGVFEGSSALQICRIRASVPPAAGSGLFNGCPVVAVLVTTMQAYYQYANHTAWGAYKERLRLAEPDPSYISYEIYFDSGERRTNRDDPLKLPTRSTAPSSRLVLAPVLWGFSAGAEFTWTVRTATVDAEGHATAGSETTAGSRGTAEYFNFQSAAPGTYLVSCTAREAGNTASAAVLVQVVNPAAARARGPQSSRSPNACYGAVDAPQQHLGMYPGFDISGENGHGETWMTAQHGKRLRNEPTEEPGVGPYWGGWSLGPLGYLIFGFDHSIMARESGDEIGIRGNAFSGWEEPGIISVMQDTNGNGLPDDTWYELKGSQHGRYGHIPRYAMRYFYPFKKTGGSSFRPVGNFVWVDNRGNTGAERQPYPWFVAGESITFSGTIVAQGTGMTGYTDTHDTKFSIADAVQADGTPVSLDHIDFVRVHGAVTGGGFGGYSTEIAGMADASIPLDAATLPGEPAATEGQYNYTFINDSGYVLTVDLYILSEGNAVQMTRFTLDTGVTAIKQYQFNPLIVEFSGGNAELAITSSTARFTSTGGGGI